jgi:hypothetical protein
MRLIASAFATLISAATVFFCVPAHAQTWVSGVGNDQPPCSRNAPCRTLNFALGVTNAGGKITVLDPGDYGPVTITKSVTITNDGAGQAGMWNVGGATIRVNVGPLDIVTLRGLVLDGGTSGVAGIDFQGAGVLHVQNCVIKSFRALPAWGIYFRPLGVAELYASDCAISDNGKNPDGGGILVQPASGPGGVKVVLERLFLANNTSGIVVNNTSGPALIHVTVRNSTVAGGAETGIVANAVAAGAKIYMFVDRSSSVSNGKGIVSNGGFADVWFGNSTVTGNETGLQFLNGGRLTSYQNNQIDGNLANGSPSQFAALH